MSKIFVCRAIEQVLEIINLSHLQTL